MKTFYHLKNKTIIKISHYIFVKCSIYYFIKAIFKSVFQVKYVVNISVYFNILFASLSILYFTFKFVEKP